MGEDKVRIGVLNQDIEIKDNDIETLNRNIKHLNVLNTKYLNKIKRYKKN